MDPLPFAEMSALQWSAAAGVGALAVGAAALVIKGKKKPPETREFASAAERLSYALGKSRSGLLAGIKGLLSRKIDEDALGALEQMLLQADCGVATTEHLVEQLKQAFREGKLEKQEDVLAHLKRELKARMGGDVPKLTQAASGPTVILVVGVNGVGKTTSISKLARHLAEQGKKVLLGASDTFRAAAVDQLQTWAERLDLEIVRGQPGQDPANVAHDAAEKALSKDFDVLIVDTAGRLHSNKNLMSELGKINRVLGNKIAGAPHEVLLVIDATTGQNAVQQAEAFNAVAPLTGVFLAKIDGSAKGGIVLRIHQELSVPVKFVGTGEQPEDIAPFDADKFVEAMFSS